MPKEYASWAWKLKIMMIFLRAGKHALRCLLQHLLLLYQRIYHPEYRFGANHIDDGRAVNNRNQQQQQQQQQHRNPNSSQNDWSGFVVCDKSIPVLLDAVEAVGVFLLYLLNLGNGKLSFCMSDMMYTVSHVSFSYGTHATNTSNQLLA